MSFFPPGIWIVSSSFATAAFSVIFGSLITAALRSVAVVDTKSLNSMKSDNTSVPAASSILGFSPFLSATAFAGASPTVSSFPTTTLVVVIDSTNSSRIVGLTATALLTSFSGAVGVTATALIAASACSSDFAPSTFIEFSNSFSVTLFLWLI